MLTLFPLPYDFHYPYFHTNDKYICSHLLCPIKPMTDIFASPYMDMCVPKVQIYIGISVEACFDHRSRFRLWAKILNLTSGHSSRSRLGHRLDLELQLWLRSRPGCGLDLQPWQWLRSRSRPGCGLDLEPLPWLRSRSKPGCGLDLEPQLRSRSRVMAVA